MTRRLSLQKQGSPTLTEFSIETRCSCALFESSMIYKCRSICLLHLLLLLGWFEGKHLAYRVSFINLSYTHRSSSLSSSLANIIFRLPVEGAAQPRLIGAFHFEEMWNVHVFGHQSTATQQQQASLFRCSYTISNTTRTCLLPKF